ncbi:MAG: M48 family metallopeptidase [Oculatellaceae cyanobacterium Prado106]|jgi:predicted Zn-dependent protease|nr:M48 family metallopeptidase [Oculatellaceae cyanobacterium Prado106]
MSSFFSGIRQKFRRRLVYGLLSLLVAFGLVVSTPQPSPAIPWGELILRGVQVIQLSNISDEQEVELGKQINDQLTSQEVKIYGNRGIQQYINEIGQRLAQESDRPGIPYTFQVVEDSNINAFATMGGFVYVTTGLMRAADNEAQLASVMGHEIGHIVARHSVEQLRERTVRGGLLSAAGLDRSTLANIAVELTLNRPNSRSDEYEADELGLTNIVRVGYAPSASVAFLEKLLNQGSVPTFLSTHPATNDRIERLQALVDESSQNSGGGMDSAAYRSRTSVLR